MSVKQGQLVWAVTTIVVASIAGIVALAAVGDKDATTLLPLLIGFLAPTVTALINTHKQDVANAKLERIDGRLNGELDKRIAAAVAVALTEYHAAKAGDCAGDAFNDNSGG